MRWTRMSEEEDRANLDVSKCCGEDQEGVSVVVSEGESGASLASDGVDSSHK